MFGRKVRAKATWGRISNFKNLSYAHQQLLAEELNPNHKKVTSKKVTKKAGAYFDNMNSAIGHYEPIPGW